MNQPLNFIFIIMDDLTWGDLNVHGNPYTQTPVLNQLHKRSTRLNYYRSGSLCTPARSAIMTGRYPYRTRAFDTYCGRSMIDPDEQTIASYLRDGGYATCLSGKWHLGDNYPNRPSEMGFDQYLMHTGGGLCQPANYGNNDYFDPELLQDGQYVKTKGYCTDIFTNYAMDFIEAKQDQPFFIYLATNAPHSPMICGEEWYKPFVDQGLNEELAKLYGMVENIDYNIGRILNYLEHLQLHENTMVIFTSDHGHCPSATFDGKARYNWGLRGGKGTPYEVGARVPCFWYLPGVLAEDRSIEKETGTIDVFPTLQSFAGLNFPTKNKIDGADLKELMVMGKSNTFLDSRPIMLQWHRGDIPIPYRNFHVVKEGYKLCKLEETDDFELFYIPDDPGEQNNLATQQPKKVKELKEIYDCCLVDVSKTRPDNFAPTPKVAGTKFQKKV
ncbi:MAG: arylsulfatase, partial [Lentisphaeria bacterium]|nr:arylsulfatase [Lentisphaeria bacterium]